MQVKFESLRNFKLKLDGVCLCADLQVVLRDDDGATPGDLCTGLLAITMRVTSLPHVLIGCTLSEDTNTCVNSCTRL